MLSTKELDRLAVRVSKYIVADILASLGNRYPMQYAPNETKNTMTIQEFCDSYGISRSTFYNLQEEGAAPDVVRVRHRVLITKDAASEWLKMREA